MSAITAFLSNLKHKNIVVIGDIVIDEYYPVSVTRISPEFPIPVLNTPDERCITKPGGAANVAYQFNHFPVKTFLVTFLDEKAINALKQTKIELTSSLTEDECQVPLKKRYYDESHDFPLCRVDVEKPNYGLEKIQSWRKELVKQFSSLIKNEKIDFVICSDYNKGVFDHNTATEIISICKKRHIPTLVDPKTDHLRWVGCTYFKPNEKEARDFTQHSDQCPRLWYDVADVLQAELNCKAVILTHGGKGVSGNDGEKGFRYAPAQQTDARSVIGAGDCFAATFALASAHGFPTEEAAEIAFESGAVYVQKMHNEPITPQELLHRADPIASKIVTREQLCYIRSSDPARKYVFTNGCFDLLHEGHINTLRFAKSKGDRLIVAVNTDESIRKLKGPTRPILPLDERMKVLAALECVDYVVCFGEETPYQILKDVGPNVLVKGGDYCIENVVGTELVDEVFLTNLVEGRSTSEIIKKISGDSHDHDATTTSGSA